MHETQSFDLDSTLQTLTSGEHHTQRSLFSQLRQNACSLKLERHTRINKGHLK